MNPYHVVGMITICTVFFAGVVSLLVVQGVPVPIAFLSVYGLVVVWMRGMQRRASQVHDSREELKREVTSYPSLEDDAVSTFR